MKTLTPAERLIVAADFKPQEGHGRNDVIAKVINLASQLKGTGVYLKVNSALRACGYELIDIIHEHGLNVFADLKLVDIGDTLATDGELLREAKPELLTVFSATGITAMKALKAALPETEILGVTVLTSLKEEDTAELFNCSVNDAVVRLGKWAHLAGLGGWICAPKEAHLLRPISSEMSVNTPNIRSANTPVKGDGQNLNRAMTVAEAMKAGIDRIVVGRLILQDPDPYDATMRIIDEIAVATAA